MDNTNYILYADDTNICVVGKTKRRHFSEQIRYWRMSMPHFSIFLRSKLYFMYSMHGHSPIPYLLWKMPLLLVFQHHTVYNLCYSYYYFYNSSSSAFN